MNMSGGLYSGSIERERRAIERQSAKLARNLYLCSNPGVRNTSSLDYLALSEEFSMEVVGSIKKSFKNFKKFPLAPLPLRPQYLE
jgi:hypothetical protein